jgi:DNA-binding response OmpR family regulator
VFAPQVAAVGLVVGPGYSADVLDSAGPGEDVPELVGKPVSPREFLARVRKLLDRAAAEAEHRQREAG